MEETVYKGYKMYSFTVGGRESRLVCPRDDGGEKKWIWRAEYFGAFDEPDMALVERGWYLGYHNCGYDYGCERSVDYLKEFHTYMTESFGLEKKTCLFGFSVGGLYSVNYALKYPDDVFALYLDAPVMDILSWPGAYPDPKKTEYPDHWERCKEVYGLTDETALDFKGNPYNRAEELAKDGIPILAVIGAEDKTVLPQKNIMRFADGFLRQGGELEIIVKPGCGHHPHTLADPAPIVYFTEERRKRALK